MFRSRNSLILLALTALPLLALGCGKSQDAGDPDVERHKNVLTELFEMYSVYAKKNQKPPQRVADLTQKDNQTIHPAGAQALQSGEYTVVYGTDLTATADAILAYHKSVPNDGGWVLLANGNVKQMTAAEFNAPKK